ncbi:MAG: bifunctional [glutamate--ammonia ligase]-adenylyl-L-tyrosine phosphorylase/[glutamate--ammonia-ligase] adenylyltransferase [Rhodocyclaceae bacterium]|nr:bifunctional [glutamate--ammonia ligase]-adenylyl-L-tyrosine phosphorylase/[glutamate--ammonia-ligase] adenylyltransferase [Rhodocyclaceae bacterium]
MPEATDAFASRLEQVGRHSRFLQRQLQSRPWLAECLAGSVDRPLEENGMRAWLAEQTPNEHGVADVLRRLRAWTLCHLAYRDLAGLADLAEVTETMSALADVAVDTAHDILCRTLKDRHGTPRNAEGVEQRLMVIGMGKLGGRELNVSSDVDFIFVFPDDGDTDGARPISNFEFFTKLGQRLIRSLNEITAEGQVFRVDMRLRPNGDSGPLVCNLDMLEHYFIAQGREWERYAWIKARLMIGGNADALQAVVRPFVFRKYLDFGAINAMRDLHAQIRREVSRRDMADNIKLGPGGIREIEFIAQVFQLIRGGRDPGLQIKPTLDVLARLRKRSLLPAEAVDELSQAYVFLRRLEHRLQYLDDQQTHLLPQDQNDRLLVAEAMGYDDHDALMRALDHHRRRVGERFDAVFEDPTEADHPLDKAWQGCGEADECEAALLNLGFADPEQAARSLGELRSSGRYRQMPPAIRARFDGLMPRVLEIAASKPNADATLARMIDLLAAISRRAAYLALLQQYPQALARLADLVSASQWASHYLVRHPILLDELLDGRQLDARPDWTAFRAELEQEVRDLGEDMERQMDVMRERHHAQVFRLLTQDLSGSLSVEALADHLSALADIILETTIGACWPRVRKRHRENPRFAVISYGKHGGKELGYSSDLDIVYLFDDEDADAAEHYSRLGQRISTWLSSQTAAGQLYETDLRLRPNGDAGLLVTSLEAFRKYQLESAWTWEHQALTRARFSAGDPEVGDGFERIRREVLRQRRDLATLRDEVIEMRQKMFDAHGGRGEEFDLKHDFGGLVDVEFLVQFLVLGHAHDHPGLSDNLGNIALLGLAAELDLIDREGATEAADAYRSLRHHQHALRLNGTATGLPPERVATETAAVQSLWTAVFGDGGHRRPAAA